MRPYGPGSPWRLDPAVTYLNHGSFGACPVPVLEAQRALIDELEAGPVRFLWATFEARIDAARLEVAAFLGADPEGLVFVPNATTGVSTVLRSLRFEPGDELLTTNHEYNAVVNALREVARSTGARVVVARLPLEIEAPEHAVDAILAAVTPRTRLAVVSQVTSPTATILPIAELVRALDARGVDLLVDGAHAPGMVALGLDRLGAAYWTGNGHKWLCGPKGSGVLHVRADRRAAIHPLVISHGFNDERPDRSRLWKEFDWTGTGDPTPYLALPVALRAVEALHADGWPGVMTANRDLVLDGRRRVAAALGVMPRTPDELLGSMATIPLPLSPMPDDEIDALKASIVADDRIEAPILGWPVPAARDSPGALPSAVAVRISAQRYNEPADYDRLAEVLARRLAAR
ncbi:MAG TPA: aminotransferase class V-fold PLP-dependent enzyme [Candidatus Sulfomarinibacteraceae bacterium]|nr:aminotransferase class V-fold PLP-dependent enzyme [Candidatus Sulfomarinibacteraceae bacterium]